MFFAGSYPARQDAHKFNAFIGLPAFFGEVEASSVLAQPNHPDRSVTMLHQACAMLWKGNVLHTVTRPLLVLELLQPGASDKDS